MLAKSLRAALSILLLGSAAHAADCRDLHTPSGLRDDSVLTIQILSIQKQNDSAVFDRNFGLEVGIVKTKTCVGLELCEKMFTGYQPFVVSLTNPIEVAAESLEIAANAIGTGAAILTKGSEPTSTRRDPVFTAYDRSFAVLPAKANRAKYQLVDGIKIQVGDQLNKVARRAARQGMNLKLAYVVKDWSVPAVFIDHEEADDIILHDLYQTTTQSQQGSFTTTINVDNDLVTLAFNASCK